MNSQDIELARVTTQAEKDQLERELGEHLLAGGDEKHGAELTKRLSRASAKLEEIDRKTAAITAAQNASARVAADRAERDAQEALERRINDFQADHASWVAIAAEIDALSDKLIDACGRYEQRGDDLVVTYASLGLNQNTTAVAKNAGGRYAQLFLNLRNHGSGKMRSFLYNTIRAGAWSGTGHKRTMVELTPSVPAFFTGREKRGKVSA